MNFTILSKYELWERTSCSSDICGHQIERQLISGYKPYWSPCCPHIPRWPPVLGLLLWGHLSLRDSTSSHLWSQSPVHSGPCAGRSQNSVPPDASAGTVLATLSHPALHTQRLGKDHHHWRGWRALGIDFRREGLKGCVCKGMCVKRHHYHRWWPELDYQSLPLDWK